MSKTADMRLDRLLANLGYGSRRDMQALARNGYIKLDGLPLHDIDQRVPLTQDFAARLDIDGEAMDPLPGMALMLNKPVGVTCSHKEAGALVFSLLPERWRRRDPLISTVGRLDKDTSGLLLMTDDGAYLHQVISPRRHIAKRYVASLATPLRGNEAEIFASGKLMLEGETNPLLPASLEAHSPREVELTITEGRYHQVRRMFAAVNNHVEALHRVSIGGLMLPDDLATGEFRVLDADQRACVLGRRKAAH